MSPSIGWCSYCLDDVLSLQLNSSFKLKCSLNPQVIFNIQSSLFILFFSFYIIVCHTILLWLIIILDGQKLNSEKGRASWVTESSGNFSANRISDWNCQYVAKSIWEGEFVRKRNPNLALSSNMYVSLIDLSL